ncbi:Olfactory receptor 7G1 [Sciurus carolinensis]|uniref:Olfactory receptor n=1 Tax=Sciurus carolinensis TaxID=30640 RepID=A0AA41NE48_SCICA|nr:Olfactory receptor 7G1 [Sciurus carolinensis]
MYFLHFICNRFINILEATNETAVSEFLPLGLTNDRALQSLIFSPFLSVYLVTILGNLIIIMAISSDSDLHTPNLSFTDICLSTSMIPKMLVNILTQTQSITYTCCLMQVCFVLVFGVLENCLLAVMAYDRYIAVCHPLRYIVIMSPCLCKLLKLFSFLVSIVDDLPHSLMVLRLSFCTNLEIPHFFCELVQVIKLACSDTLLNNILVYVMTSILGGLPLLGIVFSYIKIVSSIMQMPSAGRKSKAFSTCGSHLSVVSLFYGVYISSAVTDLSRKSAIASVMYSVVPPMLNPFIYSLRNRDMKKALMKIIQMSTL